MQHRQSQGDLMDPLAEPLFASLDPSQLMRIAARLGTAALLGGVLGFERERVGKAAGLRTHMLVALGSALFIVAPLEAGMDLEGLSRVIQGIAAGIGFIGAGTILKRKEEDEIKGLTTAASLWLTSAVGMAVGVGRLWLPLVAVLLAFLILHVLVAIERLSETDKKAE
jgi:putative Mg2+ transporter-C (MgtC) family protein